MNFRRELIAQSHIFIEIGEFFKNILCCVRVKKHGCIYNGCCRMEYYKENNFRNFSNINSKIKIISVNTRLEDKTEMFKDVHVTPALLPI